MLNPLHNIPIIGHCDASIPIGFGRRALVVVLLSLILALPGTAQEETQDEDIKSETRELITVYKVPVKTQFGERMPTIQLHNVNLYRPLYFKNAQERVRFTRLMRDVKKTLPYAKMVKSTLMETYEYMETLPTEDAKIKHLKRMEKELFNQYMPEMKKLTLTQGKLLMKLINRETNSSSYQLLDTFLGSFAAGFWNVFAQFFGGDLRTTWDPNGADAEIERVCTLVEYGII